LTLRLPRCLLPCRTRPWATMLSSRRSCVHELCRGSSQRPVFEFDA
jgi:hypothetical protein